MTTHLLDRGPLDAARHGAVLHARPNTLKSVTDASFVGVSLQV